MEMISLGMMDSSFPPPPGRGAPPLLITTGDGKIRLNPCDSGTKHKRDNNEQDAEVVDLLYANDT